MSQSGVTIEPTASAATIDIKNLATWTVNAGLILHDVTILSSGVDRSNSIAGGDKTELDTGALGFDTAGAVALTNVRIHGVSDLGWWEGCTGTLAGCLFQDIGFDAPDRGHGHALYSQNKASDGLKTLDACIFVKGYGDNVQVYGSDATYLEGYRFNRDIFMHGGIIVGGTDGTDDIQFDDCSVYATLQLGYGSDVNLTASLTNSIINIVQILPDWQSMTVQDCICFGNDAGRVVILGSDAVTVANLHIDYNVYISAATHPFVVEGLSFMTLAEWRTYSGQDAHSAHYTSVAAAVTAGAITVPLVKVYPVNEGDHIANVAVWNPLEAASVNVDLSELPIEIDDELGLRQVRDYTGDVRAFTYTGALVPVVMSGTSSYPAGHPTQYHPDAIPDNALPTFGAFELWRAS